MTYTLTIKRVSKKTNSYSNFSVTSENHKTILSCFKHSLDIVKNLGKYSDYYFWLRDVIHLISREIEDIELGIKTPQKFNTFEWNNETYNYFVGVTIW